MYLLSRLCPQSHPSRGERVFAGPGYNQSATLLLGERSVIVFPSGFLKTTKQNQWPSGVTHPRLLIFKHGDGWGNRAVLVKGTGDGTRFRRLTKWQKGVKRQAGGTWGNTEMESQGWERGASPAKARAVIFQQMLEEKAQETPGPSDRVTTPAPLTNETTAEKHVRGGRILTCGSGKYEWLKIWMLRFPLTIGYKNTYNRVFSQGRRAGEGWWWSVLGQWWKVKVISAHLRH